MTNITIKDSVGNEIHEGAILRWFHFSSGRKKYYMYKQVGEQVLTKSGKTLLWIHHLPYKPDAKELENGFWCSRFTKDGKIEDCVVVDCFCDKHVKKDLKRSKVFRD